MGVSGYNGTLKGRGTSGLFTRNTISPTPGTQEEKPKDRSGKIDHRFKSVTGESAENNEGSGNNTLKNERIYGCRFFAVPFTEKSKWAEILSQRII